MYIDTHPHIPDLLVCAAFCCLKLLAELSESDSRSIVHNAAMQSLLPRVEYMSEVDM
jgi:hypothetical protein